MHLEYGEQRVALTGGELVLGSDPGTGLVIAGALPRHAVVRQKGEAGVVTIQPLTTDAQVEVNGVRVGREPMPLMDGDAVRIAGATLIVSNPAGQVGTPGAPPEGARERLHDTMFGLPRDALRGAIPPVRPTPAPPTTSRPRARPWMMIAAAGVLILILLLALLAF